MHQRFWMEQFQARENFTISNVAPDLIMNGTSNQRWVEQPKSVLRSLKWWVRSKYLSTAWAVLIFCSGCGKILNSRPAVELVQASSMFAQELDCFSGFFLKKHSSCVSCESLKHTQESTNVSKGYLSTCNWVTVTSYYPSTFNKSTLCFIEGRCLFTGRRQ